MRSVLSPGLQSLAPSSCSIKTWGSRRNGISRPGEQIVNLCRVELADLSSYMAKVVAGGEHDRAESRGCSSHCRRCGHWPQDHLVSEGFNDQLFHKAKDLHPGISFLPL